MFSSLSSFGEKMEQQDCGILVASAISVNITTLVLVIIFPDLVVHHLQSIFTYDCWSRPHIHLRLLLRFDDMFYNSYITEHCLLLVSNIFLNHYIIVWNHCFMQTIYSSLSVYTVKIHIKLEGWDYHETHM